MRLEDSQKTLHALESELAAAAGRRNVTVRETRLASAMADRIGHLGDQRPRNSLGPLNKQAAALDAEIKGIQGEIAEAKRSVELAKAYELDVAKKQAARGGDGRSVVFEISTPDGRTIRQNHPSLEAAQRALQPGYVVSGEVIGAGVVNPIAGPSFMESLLAAQGDELIAWLALRGVVPTMGVEQ